MLSAAVLSFVISDFHHLFHKCSHLFRRFILCLPCSVGVGAESEAGVVVSQHGGYRFYVYAVLQRHRCEGMPLWHNKIGKPLQCKELTGLSLFFFHLIPCKK